jgi:hypothetical protein
MKAGTRQLQAELESAYVYVSEQLDYKLRSRVPVLAQPPMSSTDQRHRIASEALAVYRVVQEPAVVPMTVP